jgi:hypothetical protein
MHHRLVVHAQKAGDAAVIDPIDTHFHGLLAQLVRIAMVAWFWRVPASAMLTLPTLTT